MAGAADRLRVERDHTRARIATLKRDFDDIVEASTLVALDDEHDPDGATVAFERAQVASLLAEARAYLDEIDAALARVDAGTYGTCEVCGEPIAAARLDARPTATRCVTCAGRAAG